MATTTRGLRLRRSFRDIERDHYELRKSGFKGPTELENLVLAWKGIQELPAEDLNSHFVIGGYHGEPFRGAGWSNPMWWGGYCFHGQILFPTWHRAYCKRLEDAMRSIPGCSTVTLPFLDWCDIQTKESGIPETITQPEFELGDGTKIKNPLYSYQFQKGTFHGLPASNTDDNGDYTKTKGYRTVRFPFSGLDGTDAARRKAQMWNDRFENPKRPEDDPTRALNGNVKDWLYYSFEQTDDKGDKQTVHHGTAEKFRRCLDAPNYTLFSNTTSAGQHNTELLDGGKNAPQHVPLVTSLESPHNDMHLAVGGFNLPAGNSNPDDYKDANGDMGENDTAGFDPIFFLHHCYIDRMFWLWQLKHNQINELDISPQYAEYPGANSMDSQGPTPGKPAGNWLSLDTTLDPFRKADGALMTSRDLINIETQLGYTYGPGSFTDPAGNLLDQAHAVTAPHAAVPLPQPLEGAVTIRGVNRGQTAGSFYISAVQDRGAAGKVLLGWQAVLSRWHVAGCANCQTHLMLTTHIPLHGVAAGDFDADKVDVLMHTRDHPAGLDLKKMSRDAGKPVSVVPKFPALHALPSR